MSKEPVASDSVTQYAERDMPDRLCFQCFYYFLGFSDSSEMVALFYF